jgi:nicotinic acid mononucleotide adenylyltransferase
MQACGLDEIVFLPERRPRGKHNVTDISHRIALIERATRTIASFRVLSLPSEQFTVKSTLPQLRSTFGNAHLTFLMGSDVVRTFPYRWDGLEVLFREVSFAIGIRSGDDPDEAAAIMANMGQTYDTATHYTCIHAANTGLASSQIRDGTLDVSHLHPDTLDYIHEHGLYYQV